MDDNTTPNPAVDSEAAQISEVPDKSMNEGSTALASDFEKITIAPSEPKATVNTSPEQPLPKKQVLPPYQ